jgi:hypothetical protein
MVVSERAPIALGLSAPTPAQLASLLLPATNGALRVIADLPLSREAADAFRAGASGNPLLQVQTAAAGADYALVGRVRNGGVEYAWVRPQIVDVNEASSVLPPDTEWIAAATDPAALASRLRDLAVRLSVIKNWLDLESPPDAGKFPYRLMLKHATTGAQVDGPVAANDDSYGLVLTRERGVDTTRVERRYVYVFAIDQNGESVLAFPSDAAGNVENRLPLNVDKLDQLPIEIPLGRRDLFKFKDPGGVDTFVLLTTAIALPNPSALAGEAVRATSRSLADPLTTLLVQGGTRGIRMTTPTDWSIERLTIKTRK